MIAPHLRRAAAAPLRDCPSHLEAEVRYLADRDRTCLFAAALAQWSRANASEPELAL